MGLLNATDMSNISSLQHLLIQANTNTAGTFWTGIYWMLVSIIFLSSLAFGWEVGVVLAFFGGLLIGMFLLYLGLMNIVIFGMTEAILLFILMYLMYSTNKGQ